jgi:hypothetical protein
MAADLAMVTLDGTRELVTMPSLEEYRRLSNNQLQAKVNKASDALTEKTADDSETEDEDDAMQEEEEEQSEEQQVLAAIRHSELQERLAEAQRKVMFAVEQQNQQQRRAAPAFKSVKVINKEGDPALMYAHRPLDPTDLYDLSRHSSTSSLAVSAAPSARRAPPPPQQQQQQAAAAYSASEHAAMAARRRREKEIENVRLHSAAAASPFRAAAPPTSAASSAALASAAAAYPRSAYAAQATASKAASSASSAAASAAASSAVSLPRPSLPSAAFVTRSDHEQMRILTRRPVPFINQAELKEVLSIFQDMVTAQHDFIRATATPVQMKALLKACSAAIQSMEILDLSITNMDIARNSRRADPSSLYAYSVQEVTDAENQVKVAYLETVSALIHYNVTRIIAGLSTAITVHYPDDENDATHVSAGLVNNEVLFDDQYSK